MDKRAELVVTNTVKIILVVISLLVFILAVIFFKNKGVGLIDGIKKIFISQ